MCEYILIGTCIHRPSLLMTMKLYCYGWPTMIWRGWKRSSRCCGSENDRRHCRARHSQGGCEPHHRLRHIHIHMYMHRSTKLYASSHRRMHVHSHTDAMLIYVRAHIHACTLMHAGAGALDYWSSSLWQWTEGNTKRAPSLAVKATTLIAYSF